jgi:methyl-accepting chemotaxis protein
VVAGKLFVGQVVEQLGLEVSVRLFVEVAVELRRAAAGRRLVEVVARLVSGRRWSVVEEVEEVVHRFAAVVEEVEEVVHIFAAVVEEVEEVEHRLVEEVEEVVYRSSAVVEEVEEVVFG